MCMRIPTLKGVVAPFLSKESVFIKKIVTNYMKRCIFAEEKCF